MKIIPAIDIYDGQVVRLTQGNYNQQTTYRISLEAMINEYQKYNINFIHVVDLNGARGDDSNEEFLMNMISGKKIGMQVGGGIRSIEKINRLLEIGVDRTILGTAAVTDPDFLIKVAGEIPTGKIIIAIDVKDEIIMYNGWQQAAPVNMYEFVDMCRQLGFNRFLCTDITRDGVLEGCNVDLYRNMLEHDSDIQLIASGGIGSMKDIEALAEINVESVVVGKAIYEGKISIENIQTWNEKEVDAC